jgi:pectin methylesterase-like acyl-CoA thioesterase
LHRATVLLVLFGLAVSCATATQSIRAIVRTVVLPEDYPRTIVVPDAYGTIQDAVDNASSGDTVFVTSGTYIECVNISKSLSLIGEHKAETIIL